MAKTNFKVKGMHCTSCAALIEADLEDAGAKASCSYARETLDVEYDETILSVEKITQVVKNTGYELERPS